MNVAITGGSSGIGLACALEYAAKGCDVALVARTLSKLEAAREEVLAARSNTSSRVLIALADLSDETETRRAFSELFDSGFEPDLLINSAGVIVPGEFTEMASAEFDKNIDYGFWTVVNPCRVVAPRMKERQNGHIVNVSSVAGYLGIYGYTGYSAAKFAVMGFTEALRFELLPEGVKVSVVCPPDTDTPALAYEKTLRPPETDAAAGNIKAIPAAAVARGIVKGVSKGRFHIIPDRLSAFYFRLKGLCPEIFFLIVDGDVAKCRARRGASS